LVSSAVSVRLARIHSIQFSSAPVITSAAMIAWRISFSIGFVIAAVSPELIAIARKTALSGGRFGNPNDTLLAPQQVLQPSSSCTRRTIRKTCLPA
jgi:hypothetical protein